MSIEEKIRKACEGKTASTGGLNIPEIREIIRSRGINTATSKMSRAELLKILCVGLAPKASKKTQEQQLAEILRESQMLEKQAIASRKQREEHELKQQIEKIVKLEQQARQSKQRHDRQSRERQERQRQDELLIEEMEGLYTQFSKLGLHPGREDQKREQKKEHKKEQKDTKKYLNPDVLVKQLIDKDSAYKYVKSLLKPDNKRKTTDRLDAGTFAPLPSGHTLSVGLQKLGAIGRVGATAEGTCLVHAFLLGSSPTYRSLNALGQARIGQAVRRHLADLNLEEYAPSLVEHMKEVEIPGLPNTIPEYQTFLRNIGKTMGDREWLLLSEVFGYDFVIYNDATSHVYCMGWTYRVERPLIVLYNVKQNHYELVFSGDKYEFTSLTDKGHIIEYYNKCCYPYMKGKC